MVHARSVELVAQVVSTLDSVSWSRLTLLPLSRVGSSDFWVVGSTEVTEPDARLPSSTALRRLSSKLTRVAWYPGVSTFAMLSAIARWRAARPDSALPRATLVTSSNTDRTTR